MRAKRKYRRRELVTQITRIPTTPIFYFFSMKLRKLMVRIIWFSSMLNFQRGL